MRKNQGFTILELLVALTLTIIVGTLVITQKNDIDASHRDQQRKTALNSVYYGLTKAYYPVKKSYPTTVDAKILPYVEPALFETIGGADYKLYYIGKECKDDVCQGFELRIKLEKEDTYKKSS